MWFVLVARATGRVVDYSFGGYSYINCEVVVGIHICGHVGHLRGCPRTHHGWNCWRRYELGSAIFTASGVIT